MSAHGVAVGDVADAYLAIDPNMYEHGFSLSSKLYFTLWDSTNKQWAKNVVRILVDAVTNHLE